MTTYPNNDLWSVRQIEFLKDALEGYEGKTADYYPEKNLSLSIPGIATYTYTGVLNFPNQDRTIILEQGEGFGLKPEEVLAYLKQKSIVVTVHGNENSVELFDLVDANDSVIGTTHKKEAHTKGLLHRVGAVYVFDRQGRLYVQVHKSSGGLYDHSVGGHISQGESYLEGTRREAEEELGITQPLEHLSTFYSDEGPRLQHMFGLYTCVADKSWTFVPNEEVEEIIPMELDAIRKLMRTHPEKFTRGFINTMREYTRLQE